MDGASDRARRDGERDLALAHTTALFTRVKKLETLTYYLPRPAPTHAPGAMLARLKEIASQTKELG